MSTINQIWMEMTSVEEVKDLMETLFVLCSFLMGAALVASVAYVASLGLTFPMDVVASTGLVGIGFIGLYMCLHVWVLIDATFCDANLDKHTMWDIVLTQLFVLASNAVMFAALLASFVWMLGLLAG